MDVLGPQQMFRSLCKRLAAAGAFAGLALLLLGLTIAGYAEPLRIPLRVPAGSALRVYLIKKVPFRLGAPVEARVAEPVWAFDRVVIPKGAIAQGSVTRLIPVSRFARATLLMSGDFTPLKHAEVCFNKIILSGGKQLSIRTEGAYGSGLYYEPKPNRKAAAKQKQGKSGSSQANSKLAFLRQTAQAQVNAQTGGVIGLVRGQNRKEWLEAFLLNKLPYRPQWYSRLTMFTAVLVENIDFGDAIANPKDLASLGAEPAPDTIAQMRLLNTTTSATARRGDPLEGVLAAPVFDAQHRLTLPEGTRVHGRITFAQRARLLHRGGRLRFLIESVELPQIPGLEDVSITDSPGTRPVRAQLDAAEVDPKKVKVDEEGTAQARDSKTRLLHPAVAALVAAKSLDNDSGRQNAAGSATGSPNTAGLTLGGFSGFGFFGTLLAQGPPEIGAALGFYGLAWSAYTNVFAKGSDVVFAKNTELAIKFGNPPPKKSAKR
jgi:hypothetical protein